ncbi:transglutaminase-like domain-containing protein [Arcobacter arenosus]|uniref:Transglutaminase domain-containing protein n=1 Tax=Arcobacter arenosus TaxID=2576037 RepID=A0A5R8Y3U4_9BACT|nr:transglutaminase-like domain-containing protein [Arcobacter arenosus]TLP40779.1 transglutaminase domain-containing protein [Arcobacter arenosus]
MQEFLNETEIIDYSDIGIKKLAFQLSKGLSKHEIVKKSFEYVRDEIRHSGDHKDNQTTLKASDVLKYKTGWCYSKSHLLAAILRANNIPCALVYQRLKLNDDGSGDKFCLHGLNAVYFEEYGWFRIDARGNKKGVNAQFDFPTEKLAFQIRFKGELDIPKLYASPVGEVVKVLSSYKSYKDVINNLPDTLVM